MDQLGASIQLQWTPPPALLQHPDAALECLDTWLREVFLLEGEPPAADGEALRGGAVRLLLLANELLRLIGIAVFHPGVLLDLAPPEQPTGVWRIRALVPTESFLPPEVVPASYRLAATLLWGMAAAPPTPATIEVLHRTVQSEHIERLSPRVARPVSTLSLLLAAYRRGIPFRHLGAGCHQLGWGSRARRLQGGAIDLDSAIGLSQAQNKAQAARFLAQAGLPAPIHDFADSEERALAIADTLGWPVVVKPADRDRGEGVTIAIEDREALRRAWHHARRFSPLVLVEKQVPGICHRLQVCAGTLMRAVRRLPKAVRGDGRSTVAELIGAANEEQERLPPWRRLKPFPVDAFAEACLAREGLGLASVPEEGRWAPLRPFNANEWGGVVEDCIATLHPDNAELAVRAARLFGFANAGIDFISTDPHIPWHQNGAVISEVNFAPQVGDRFQSTALTERLLEAYLPGQGRIPLTVCLGGEGAFFLGRRSQEERAASGLRCFLTSHDISLKPDGSVLPLRCEGAFARCLALLADPDVEALVVVAQTDEWLRTGLPFDRADTILVAEDPPFASASRSGAEILSQLQELLAGVPAPPPQAPM